MITLHSYIFPLASLSRTSTAAGSAGVSTTSSSTVYTARAFVSHHRPSVHDRPSSTPSSHPSRVRDPSTARSNSHPTHPARQTYSDRARAIHPSVHSSVRLSLSRIIHPSRARESTPRTSSTVSSGASARSASSLDIVVVVVVVCGRPRPRPRPRARRPGGSSVCINRRVIIVYEHLTTPCIHQIRVRLMSKVGFIPPRSRPLDRTSSASSSPMDGDAE